MFTAAIVPLALAASALANVFITSPTSSSTLTGGQQTTVSWIGSSAGPTLEEFGIGDFGIFAGNALEQTLLQTIATSINVSAMSSFTFTPDKTIGPNSSKYFIRVTSQTLMDPEAPQFPEEAFTAMFTMTGMTGQFNSSVQGEIDGQSTAPIGNPSTTASSGTSTASSTSVSTTTSVPTSMSTSMSMSGSMSGMSMPMTTSTGGASATSTAAGSTATNGAGKPVLATGLVALVATLVGAALL